MLKLGTKIKYQGKICSIIAICKEKMPFPMKPTFKISTERPPNWEALVLKFGVKWGKVAITYGDTVYCGVPLTPDLEIHENVHIQQQKADSAAWWKKYMADGEFRLAQELEAYQAQFKFIKQTFSDRNMLFKIKSGLARDLSGQMYGKIISYSEAFRRIG